MNGSGFAVTTALLRRLGGWHTVTMTEDYEFSAQCAMLGERVHFVPEALIYDEQPLTFRQSWKQRRRWTTGSLQGLQNYGHGLFSSFVLHGSLPCNPPGTKTSPAGRVKDPPALRRSNPTACLLRQ